MIWTRISSKVMRDPPLSGRPRAATAYDDTNGKEGKPTPHRRGIPLASGMLVFASQTVQRSRDVLPRCPCASAPRPTGLSPMPLRPSTNHDKLSESILQNSLRFRNIHPADDSRSRPLRCSIEFISICGRSAGGSSPWHTRRATSVGCRSSLSRTVSSAVAASKTAAASDRWAAALGCGPSAAPSIMLGLSSLRGTL